MQTVKIGDKFKLGPWTWTVVNSLSTSQFHAISGGIHDYKRHIWFATEDADSLVWIKEPATISKAARDEIVEWARGKMMALGGHGELKDYLDSMVRDGE